jgi:hypothetical protein
MVVAEAAKEVLWLKGLVKKLGLNQGGVQMHCDRVSFTWQRIRFIMLERNTSILGSTR